MSNSYDNYKQYRDSKNNKKISRNTKELKTSTGNFFVYLKMSILTFTALFLAGIAALNIYLSSLPPIENLKDFKPNIVTKFYSGDGEIIKTFTAYTYDKADINKIPELLKNAVIATEDKNFYSHNGYDILGIARSSIQNVIARHAVQGASTITQQLARILFLSNERTMTRKIKELEVATRIEKTISKDQILEMYLNNVYLGAGAYGVSAAAKIYFNKKLDQLTLPEMALIAGLPQAPSVYNPYNDKELAIKRRNQVLKRMLTMRYIKKDEYDKAIEAQLKLSDLPQIYTTNRAPYFSDYVMRELVEKLHFDETEIIHGGYRVITTLDSKAQDKANEVILSNMRSYGLTNKSQQAAVFSFSPVDGKILVYAGGKNYSESQYDRVTQAIRPPGSAFKPIVYAAALEKGLTPNDMIDDTPLTIAKWSPHNYGNKYRGKIPMYKALMISSNVCAARVIKEIGVHTVIQLARVLGLTTPLEKDYTISLGSNGVKLFEFVRAYGAFANGGYVVEPYAIERVEDSRGRVLYKASGTKMSHAISNDTAAQMTAMLKTVITSGTATGANIGKPAAGKTGTTDDYKDAYFVGYTPNIVTGVWVGDDNNKQMHGLTGGTIPARIWKDIMTTATEKYGNKDFNYPEIVLNGSGKSIGEEDEKEDTEQEQSKNTDEDILKEANEVKERAIENAKNSIVSPLKPVTVEDINKTFNNANNKAPTPSSKTDSIPIALPEGLR